MIGAPEVFFRTKKYEYNKKKVRSASEASGNGDEFSRLASRAEIEIFKKSLSVNEASGLRGAPADRSRTLEIK